jgi:hypothetical protein
VLLSGTTDGSTQGVTSLSTNQQNKNNGNRAADNSAIENLWLKLNNQNRVIVQLANT